ncbi:MAG: hypothetical protein AB1938_06995 [Myxococcota bacterium]
MKRADVFEVVEPPPGGLTRLKARLDAEGSQRPWWILGPAVAAAAVLVLLLVRPSVEPLRTDVWSRASLGISRPAQDVTLLHASEPMVQLSPASSDVAVFVVLAAPEGEAPAL